MEGIEHTCATCDHFEKGWNNRDLPCGLCWPRWCRIAERGSTLDIVAASVCMVEGTGTCDEWTEKDDD